MDNNQPVIEKPKFKANKLVIFIIIAVLLIIVILIIFLFKQKLDKNNQQQFVQQYNPVVISNGMYENKQFGYSINVPSGWLLVVENEPAAENNEYITVIQSPDFKDSIVNEFTYDLIKGARLSIWIQQPTTVRTMNEMVNFWNLGRQEHKKQSEKIIQVFGQQALLHSLGDYRNGILKDVHIIYKDKWIDIAYGAEQNNPKFEEYFNAIINSVKFK